MSLCKFLNPTDRAAVRSRKDVIEKIDRWWQTFQAKTKDLDDLFNQRKEWDLPAWMARHLHAIDERLCWEFGRDAKADGHYLVITPEAEKRLRPLVETILDRAPRLTGWTFYSYRQPESVEVALQTVEARTGEELPDTRVHARIGEFNRIDLLFESSAFTLPDEQGALNQVFVAAESLLGEETLDKWIGAIEVTPKAIGIKLLPLESLKETVEALRASIVDQLPDSTCQEFPEDTDWSLLQLQPEEQEDYPGRTDLYVGVTMLPNVFAAVLNGPPFYSASFSRRDERFCYLKIDGGGDDVADMRFGDREEMEAALNAALKPAGLGCVVGGGTGIRYTYIDLALTNVERSSEVIGRVFREGRIPKRTWLLFFDCEWQGEWIGIWDDTPPPPQPGE